MPKALSERLANYKYGDCIFCNEDTTVDSDCGKLLSDKDETISVHNYCVLFASGLSQQGEDHEGIDGFLIPDIIQEYKRGRKLRCFYCCKKPATIGCSWPGCRRCFHFYCGFKREAMFLFFDTFLAYCKDHRPQQKVAVTDADPPTATCPICMDNVEARVSNHTLKTPCCNNTWFHRTCVQRQALSAGYFFRCAICNNQDQFQQEMKNFGIYIPEHDASWEKEDNAFEDLYWRHDMCDSDPCLCPDGRKFNKPSSKWELVLCDLCGSSGCHVACGSLKNANQDWACPMCSAMLSNATEVNCPPALSPQNSVLIGGESPTRSGQTTRTAMKLMGKHPRTPLSSQTFRKKVTQSMNSPGELYNSSMDNFCCPDEDFPSYCSSNSSGLQQRYPSVPFDGTQPSTSRQGVQETEGCLHNGRKRRLSFCNGENSLHCSPSTPGNPTLAKKHCSQNWQSPYLQAYKRSQSSGLIYGPRTTCRMSMRPKKFHMSHHLRVSFHNSSKQTVDSFCRNGANACESCNDSAMNPCAFIKTEPGLPTSPVRQEASLDGRKALAQAYTKSETVTIPADDEPLSNLAVTLSRHAANKAASHNDEISPAQWSALTPDQDAQALAEIHCDIQGTSGLAANKNTLISYVPETQSQIDYQYPFCRSMDTDILQGPANPCHNVTGPSSVNNLHQVQNANIKYTNDADLFPNSAPAFSNDDTLEDDSMRVKDQGKKSPSNYFATANRHSCVSLAYLKGAKKRRAFSHRQEADEGSRGADIVLDDKSNKVQEYAEVQSPTNEEPMCFNDRSVSGKGESNLGMGSSLFPRDQGISEVLAQSLKENYHQRVDPKRSSSPLVHSVKLTADRVRVSSPCPGGSHADTLKQPIHQSPASLISQNSPGNLSGCSSGNYSFRYIWGGYDDADHVCVTPSTLEGSLQEFGTTPLCTEDHSTLLRQTDDAKSCSFRRSENTSSPALDHQWALHLSPDDCSTPCQSNKHHSLSEGGNIEREKSLLDAAPQGLSKHQPLDLDSTCTAGTLDKNAKPTKNWEKARDSNGMDDAHTGVHASHKLLASRSTQGTPDKKKWKPPKKFYCRFVGMHKRKRKASIAAQGMDSCKDEGESTAPLDVRGTTELSHKAVSTKEHMSKMKACSGTQSNKRPAHVKPTPVPVAHGIGKAVQVKKVKPPPYPCVGRKRKYTRRKDPALRVVSKGPRMQKDKFAHFSMMSNLDEDGQPLAGDTSRHLLTGMLFRRRNTFRGKYAVKRMYRKHSCNSNGKVVDVADGKNQSSAILSVNNVCQATNSPQDKRSCMFMMQSHLDTGKGSLNQDRARYSTGRLLRRKYEKDNMKRMLMPQVSVADNEQKSEEEAAGSSETQVFDQDSVKMSSILTDGNSKAERNEETPSSPSAGCKISEGPAVVRPLSVRSSPRTESSPDSGISQTYSCNIEESPPRGKMSPVMMVANYSASPAQVAQAEVHSCLKQNDPQTSKESTPSHPLGSHPSDFVMIEDGTTFPEVDRNIRPSYGESVSDQTADVFDEQRNAESVKMGKQHGENGSIIESSESGHFMTCESRTPESCTKRPHSRFKGKDFRSSSVHSNDKEVSLSLSSTPINSHQNSPQPTNLLASTSETPPVRPTRQKPSLTFDAKSRKSSLENEFPNSSKPNSCPGKCQTSRGKDKSKTNAGKHRRAFNSKVCTELFRAGEEQRRSLKEPNIESPVRCDSRVFAKSNGCQDKGENSIPNSTNLKEPIEDISWHATLAHRSHSSETLCAEGQSKQIRSSSKKPCQELFPLDSRSGRKSKSRDSRPSSASSSPLPRSKGNAGTPQKTRVYQSNSPKAISSKKLEAKRSPQLSKESIAMGSPKKGTTFEKVESLGDNPARPRFRSSEKQDADSMLPLPSSVLDRTLPRSTVNTEKNKTGTVDNISPPYSIKAWLVTGKIKSPKSSKGSSSGTPHLTMPPKEKASQKSSSSASPSKAMLPLPPSLNKKGSRTSPRIYRSLKCKSRPRHKCNGASSSSPRKGTSSSSYSSLPRGDSETNRPRHRPSSVSKSARRNKVSHTSNAEQPISLNFT